MLHRTGERRNQEKACESAMCVPLPPPTTDAFLSRGSWWGRGGAVRQMLTWAGPEEALEQRRTSAEGFLCPPPRAALWGHVTAPVG